MGKDRLVVIGGNAGGMSAASQARRRRQDDLEIVVFERTPHTSYSACGIPYYISDIVEEESDLVVRSPEKFHDKYNIHAHAYHEVREIDTKKQRIFVVDLQDQKERWEAYDDLVISTGALPIRPALSGIDADGIYAVSTLESGSRIKKIVEQEKPQRAVIVGGGAIGMEMAESFAALKMDVSVVELAPQIAGLLDTDMAEILFETIQNNGVHVYRGESVTGFETDHNRVRAVLTDKRTLQADIVVIAIGVRPDSRLAEKADIPLGVKDAIKVNTRMQTEVDHIWAAGDCAESFHLVSRKPIYIALGTVANRHGRVAGINIGGGYATFPGVLGTAITKVFDLEMSRTGLQTREIEALRLEYVSATINSLTHAGYYPDAGKITVKLLAEKRSGRVLGGQIVGEKGSAKRIDTIATAIQAGLTVDEVVNLDLCYAPPHSPVWDPVATAARKLASML